IAWQTVLSSAQPQYRTNTYAKSEHTTSEGPHAQHHRCKHQPAAIFSMLRDRLIRSGYADQYNVKSTNNYQPIAASCSSRDALSFLFLDQLHAPNHCWPVEIHRFPTA